MLHRPEIAQKILSLLRQFGWDAGLKRLREEIALIEDRQWRDDLRFFAGWMAAERELRRGPGAVPGGRG
jgi:hypothetical protein